MPQESPPQEPVRNGDEPPADDAVAKQKIPGEKEAPAFRIKKLKLWMAWWGLVVLAIGFVAFIMLAGWRARRLARHRVGPSRLGRDDWFLKPLAPPPAEDEES